MLAGELLASLTIEILPLALPVLAGANTTLRDALFPAARVNGRERPLTLKPVPLTLALETVTLVLPVLFRVAARVLLLPTATLPKSMMVGLTVSRPADITPLPVSDTLAGELLALLTTEILPVALPAVVGAKVTLKVVLWPAATVSGTESPVMLKAAPVTVT
jgi:hypothetical protein